MWVLDSPGTGVELSNENTNITLWVFLTSHHCEILALNSTFYRWMNHNLLWGVVLSNLPTFYVILNKHVPFCYFLLQSMPQSLNDFLHALDLTGDFTQTYYLVQRARCCTLSGKYLRKWAYTVVLATVYYSTSPSVSLWGINIISNWSTMCSSIEQGIPAHQSINQVFIISNLVLSFYWLICWKVMYYIFEICCWFN